jgi:hypothetical protein
MHNEVKLQLKSYQYFPNSHGPAQKTQVKRAMKKQEEHEKSEIKRGLIFTYGPAKGLSLNEPQLPGTSYEHHASRQSTNYFTKMLSRSKNVPVRFVLQ